MLKKYQQNQQRTPLKIAIILENNSQNHYKIWKTSKYSRNKKLTETFEIPKAKVFNICQNNIKKGYRSWQSPAIVKILVNIVDSPPCNIINKDLETNTFSNGTKTASVRSIYKKKSRHQPQ